MLVLIVYTVVKNVLAAASRPFWYDELCTVAVAGQPNLAALWKAFLQAKDSNPPFYCFVAYIFRHLVANQEIAYRLPSILGFACVLWCVFVFVKKRSGSLVALLSSAVLILTPLYRPYAIEARPYGFFMACLAIALVCYQRAPRVGAMLLMGVSLAAAEASHYYALFAFPAFGLAELVYFWRTKKWRWAPWLALATGLIPLVVGWPYLKGMSRFYGAHLWNRPSLLVVADSYAQLLKTYGPIALGIAATLCLLAIWQIAGTETEGAPAPNSALIVGFIALPAVAYVATALAHGGLTVRYSLPLVLGLSLGAEHLLRLVPRRGILAVAVVLVLAIGLQEIFFWKAQASSLGRLDSPAPAVEQFASSVGYSELPIMVSSGHVYVQFAYYAAPQLAKRFVGVADPSQAAAYSGSDSIDLQMLALPCCLPLQVQEFSAFAAIHPEFLLYSDGADLWDWWPARLVKGGYALRLLAEDHTRRIYLVDRARN